MSLFLLLLLYLVWHYWKWIPTIKKEVSKKVESFITSAKIAPELQGYFYKGCWAEKPEDRSLTNYLGKGTAEDCVRLAESFNYDTVALTAGDHCYGGNHGQFNNNYQKYGQLNDLIGCDFVAPESDANLVYSKSVLGNVEEKKPLLLDKTKERRKENVTNMTYNFYDTPSAEDLDDRLYPSPESMMINDAMQHVQAWKPPYPDYPFPPNEMNAEDAIMMRGYSEMPEDLIKEGMINIQGETTDVFTQPSPSEIKGKEEKKRLFPVEVDVHSSYETSAPPLNPNAGISMEDAKMLYVGQPNDYLLKKNVAALKCEKCGMDLSGFTKGGGGGEKKKKSCPSCPPCQRCPAPDFECKQIPTYSTISYDNIPAPYLSTFKSFGMG